MCTRHVDEGPKTMSRIFVVFPYTKTRASIWQDQQKRVAKQKKKSAKEAGRHTSARTTRAKLADF